MTVTSTVDFSVWVRGEQASLVFLCLSLGLLLTSSVSLGRSLEPLCASVSSSVRRILPHKVAARGRWVQAFEALCRVPGTEEGCCHCCLW